MLDLGIAKKMAEKASKFLQKDAKITKDDVQKALAKAGEAAQGSEMLQAICDELNLLESANDDEVPRQDGPFMYTAKQAKELAEKAAKFLVKRPGSTASFTKVDVKRAIDKAGESVNGSKLLQAICDELNKKGFLVEQDLKHVHRFSTFKLLNEEHLKGGLASSKTIEDIASMHNVPISKLKVELEKGKKVEKEHTVDSAIAEEIALDHLTEDPEYYTKLSSIE